MRRYTLVSVAGGIVGFVATERGVCNVLLMSGDLKNATKRLADRFPDAQHDPDLIPAFQQQLREYFAGRLKRFDVKLDLAAVTPFQRQVFKRCARIGYGRTKTYGDLARELGQPRATRAVGRALRGNPVPLVIPCHRVVASDGSLCGFSAEQGLDLKRRLLDLESSRQSAASLPCRSGL